MGCDTSLDQLYYLLSGLAKLVESTLTYHTADLRTIHDFFV
jgi:hypothetical protein